MAKHEFGIMLHTPGDERYDKYEPEKYQLISIDDEYIEKLLTEFEEILCYWHTRQRPEKNIAYCGITLIPPESTDNFITVFDRHNHGEYDEVIRLFVYAKKTGKYVIHYGI